MENKDTERYDYPFGGHIDVIDKAPREPKTSTPVLLAPGWGETPKVFEDVVAEVLKADRRAIVLNYIRVKDSSLRTHPAATEIAKAEALLTVLEDKDIDKIDVIAHSSGAISIAIAASIRPEKFRNIVLVDPAGMIGVDNFPSLLGRFSKKVIRDAYLARKKRGRKESVYRLLKEGTKFVISHPVQSLKEAVAISRSDIYEMIQGLRSSGIRVGVMAGLDDAVFPMDKIQHKVKAGGVDGFLSLRGGHDELHYQASYAKAAESLLTSLEKIPSS